MDQGKERPDWDLALEEEQQAIKLDELFAEAEGGDSAAQYQVAVYYYRGTQDIEPDWQQGWRWLEKSAENGFVKAQKVVGLLYMNGQYAPWPAISPENAVRWYYRAAEQEDGEAAYWLGTCLQEGIGVEQDQEKGTLWLEAARVLGYGEEDSESGEPSQLGADEPARQGEVSDIQEDKPAAAERRSDGGTNGVKRQRTERVHTPRHDSAYLKDGLLTGLFVLAACVILCCVVALVVNAVNAAFFITPAYNRAFFWSSAAACVILSGLACIFGYKKAYQKRKKSAWFRKTPFYKQYEIDFLDMDPDRRLQYEIYTALERVYRPCCWQDTLSRLSFREYKGYLYPGVIFIDGKNRVRPDFVILTEKAVYVLDCCHAAGRVQGDKHAKTWRLMGESGKSRELPNLVVRNERRIQVMQANLNKICPWVSLSKIPIHSLIVFGPETDIRQISVPKNKYIHVYAGGRDKIRSYLEVLESRGSLHSQDMGELVKAVEKIAQELPKRRR